MNTQQASKIMLKNPQPLGKNFQKITGMYNFWLTPYNASTNQRDQSVSRVVSRHESAVLRVRWRHAPWSTTPTHCCWTWHQSAGRRHNRRRLCLWCVRCWPCTHQVSHTAARRRALAAACVSADHCIYNKATTMRSFFALQPLKVIVQWLKDIC